MVLVAQPDDVLPILLHDADRVRKGEQCRSRGRQKIAVAIEDYDRVLGVAVEAVDPVLRIDRNSAGANIESGRRPLPFLVDPIGIFAAADDRFHALLLCIYVAAYDRVMPAVAASAWPDGRGSASPRRPWPAAPENSPAPRQDRRSALTYPDLPERRPASPAENAGHGRLLQPSGGSVVDSRAGRRRAARRRSGTSRRHSGSRGVRPTGRRRRRAPAGAASAPASARSSSAGNRRSRRDTRPCPWPRSRSSPRSARASA